jgi:hypothetical protein
MVHDDEAEFLSVRPDRNKYKQSKTKFSDAGSKIGNRLVTMKTPYGDA